MGRPNTIKDGFKLDDVKAGRYGRQLNFWDWTDRRLMQTIDLGDAGLIPLEVRFHHDPASTHGFVGAALSSAMWHWFQDGKTWKAEKVIQVAPVEHKGWPFPVPGLITDLVLSLDDRWLYFSDWLHGDIRRYDVSDPAHPKLTAQVWCGGVLGKKAAVKGRAAQRRPANAPDQPRRQAALRDQLALQHVGQPVLSRHRQAGLVPAAVGLRRRRRTDDQRPKFLVDFGKEPGGRCGPTESASRAAIARRTSGFERHTPLASLGPNHASIRPGPLNRLGRVCR